MSLSSSTLKRRQNAEPCLTLQPQPAIDAAYAVKIFLDHHPARSFSIASLACQCDVSQEQLKEAFLQVFHEPLDQYWEKAQWRALK
jgi:AraC-like DNA-binding protein